MGKEKHLIAGVIEDMIIGSPYAEVRPMIMYTSNKFLNNMVIRLNPANTVKGNLESMETILKKYNPNYPFSFRFVDQQFAKKFDEQQKTANLAIVFSCLAIFISCLGLFGLASYTAESKIKEIGIRKVLGATVYGITGSLSRDFLKLVGLSILIGSPIAWLLMDRWLAGFYYRIDIQWWVFGLVAILILLIAFSTVGYQSFRAASINPVKSLRNE